MSVLAWIVVWLIVSCGVAPAVGKFLAVGQLDGGRDDA